MFGSANEIWARVSRDTRYEVSSLGRVRSYRQGGAPKLLKPGRASHGYLTVCLGRGNTVCVHVLVAEAFLLHTPSDGYEVRHKSGVKEDCSVGNLTLGTRGQNTNDNKWQGNPRKLSVEQVQDIKSRDSEVASILADEHGVSVSSIYQIRAGRNHSDV